MIRTRVGRSLPYLMIWTNSYERLTWTPILVLIALKIDSPAALAYSASAYSAANLVGNILFGTMSDRFGRYKIAGIALLGLMVTTLLHLQAWSALALVAVRFAHGFFAAAVTPSSLAAASETAPAAGTGQVMARMGLMIAIASIVAPPFTGRLVARLDVSATLLIQAIFLLIVGGLGIASRYFLSRQEAGAHQAGEEARHGLVTEASLEAGSRAEAQSSLEAGSVLEAPAGFEVHGSEAHAGLEAQASLGGQSGFGAQSVDVQSRLEEPSPEGGLARRLDVGASTDDVPPGFDLRLAAFACIVGAAVMFGQNILFYALPLMVVEQGLGPAVVGGLIGLFAVGAAVAFMPPFSRLSDRMGRVRPILLGVSLSSLGLYFLGLGLGGTPSMAVMAPSLVAYGFGFGLAFPAVSAATADSAATTRRGMAFGLLTAAFSIGAILGPLLAQAFSGITSPFTVAAMMMAVSLSAVLLTRHVPEFHRMASRA